MASAGVTVCHCGCSELDTDPARGDVVCTKCGTVLEASLIVSQVEFEETGGGMSAVGRFVGADGRGGTSGLSGFYAGMRKESRELTLRNAKRKIAHLCVKLQLNQHCQDMSFNFFKMALHRRLTAGRKNDLVVAACIYITCRTEGTAHLLIDFSDTLKVGVYELGRTFLKLSNELHINIPAIDPCLYILRFAHKLDFGDKTHRVSMTALRLVQRMKRDWLHTGRRPSGLCGAALLLAARLHDFSRSVTDIVKVVKVHQSTVRKRLVEFGETPTSSLTLNEFMNVDLEEEQDPPAFKAARRKDKEDKTALVTSEQIIQLQKQIDLMLSDGKKRSTAWENYLVDLERSAEEENRDIMEFIAGDTTEKISDLICDELVDPDTEVLREGISQGASSSASAETIGGLGPSLKMLGLVPSRSDGARNMKAEAVLHQEEEGDGTIDLSGIDDEEIDGYLLSNEESRIKSMLWAKLNAEYLREQQAKAKFLAENPAPNKPKKKSKRRRFKPIHANSAGDAIKQMLQEKKISSKINYDVLRNLKALGEPSAEEEGETLGEGSGLMDGALSKIDAGDGEGEVSADEPDSGAEGADSDVFVRPTGRAPNKRARKADGADTSAPPKKRARGEKVKDEPEVVSSVDEAEAVVIEEPPTPEFKIDTDGMHDDDDLDHDEAEDDELSAAQLLRQHRMDMGGDEDEEDYY